MSSGAPATARALRTLTSAEEMQRLEPVIRQGHLMKKSPVRHKSYQRRWFQLTPFWLRYYKMHSKPRKGKMVTVSHDGRQVKKSKSYTYADTTMLDDRFAIDFGAEKRQFLLKAQSVEDAKMWVSLIQLAMKAYKLHFSKGPALPRPSITGRQHKWWKADSKQKHKPDVREMHNLTNPEQWEYWQEAKARFAPPQLPAPSYVHSSTWYGDDNDEQYDDDVYVAPMPRERRASSLLSNEDSASDDSDGEWISTPSPHNPARMPPRSALKTNSSPDSSAKKTPSPKSFRVHFSEEETEILPAGAGESKGQSKGPATLQRERQSALENAEADVPDMSTSMSGGIGMQAAGTGSGSRNGVNNVNSANDVHHQYRSYSARDAATASRIGIGHILLAVNGVNVRNWDAQQVFARIDELEPPLTFHFLNPAGICTQKFATKPIPLEFSSSADANITSSLPVSSLEFPLPVSPLSANNKNNNTSTSMSPNTSSMNSSDIGIGMGGGAAAAAKLETTPLTHIQGRRGSARHERRRSFGDIDPTSLGDAFLGVRVSQVLQSEPSKSVKQRKKTAFKSNNDHLLLKMGSSGMDDGDRPLSPAMGGLPMAAHGGEVFASLDALRGAYLLLINNEDMADMHSKLVQAKIEVLAPPIYMTFAMKEVIYARTFHSKPLGLLLESRAHAAGNGQIIGASAMGVGPAADQIIGRCVVSGVQQWVVDCLDVQSDNNNNKHALLHPLQVESSMLSELEQQQQLPKSATLATQPLAAEQREGEEGREDEEGKGYRDATYSFSSITLPLADRPRSEQPTQPTAPPSPSPQSAPPLLELAGRLMVQMSGAEATGADALSGASFRTPAMGSAGHGRRWADCWVELRDGKCHCYAHSHFAALLAKVQGMYPHGYPVNVSVGVGRTSTEEANVREVSAESLPWLLRTRMQSHDACDEHAEHVHGQQRVELQAALLTVIPLHAATRVLPQILPQRAPKKMAGDRDSSSPSQAVPGSPSYGSSGAVLNMLQLVNPPLSAISPTDLYSNSATKGSEGVTEEGSALRGGKWVLKSPSHEAMGRNGIAHWLHALCTNVSTLKKQKQINNKQTSLQREQPQQLRPQTPAITTAVELPPSDTAPPPPPGWLDTRGNLGGMRRSELAPQIVYCVSKQTTYDVGAHSIFEAHPPPGLRWCSSHEYVKIIADAEAAQSIHRGGGSLPQSSRRAVFKDQGGWRGLSWEGQEREWFIFSDAADTAGQPMYVHASWCENHRPRRFTHGARMRAMAGIVCMEGEMDHQVEEEEEEEKGEEEGKLQRGAGGPAAQEGHQGQHRELEEPSPATATSTAAEPAAVPAPAPRPTSTVKDGVGDGDWLHRQLQQRHVFNGLDRNCDGTISKTELVRTIRAEDPEILQLLGIRTGTVRQSDGSADKLMSLFNGIDRDSSNLIEWEEFASHFQRVKAEAEVTDAYDNAGSQQNTTNTEEEMEIQSNIATCDTDTVATEVDSVWSVEETSGVSMSGQHHTDHAGNSRIRTSDLNLDRRLRLGGGAMMITPKEAAAQVAANLDFKRLDFDYHRSSSSSSYKEGNFASPLSLASLQQNLSSAQPATYPPSPLAAPPLSAPNLNTRLAYASPLQAPLPSPIVDAGASASAAHGTGLVWQPEQQEGPILAAFAFDSDSTSRNRIDPHLCRSHSSSSSSSSARALGKQQTFAVPAGYLPIHQIGDRLISILNRLTLIPDTHPGKIVGRWVTTLPADELQELIRDEHAMHRALMDIGIRCTDRQSQSQWNGADQIQIQGPRIPLLSSSSFLAQPQTRQSFKSFETPVSSPDGPVPF